MNLQGFIEKNLFTGRSIPTRKEYQAAAIVSPDFLHHALQGYTSLNGHLPKLMMRPLLTGCSQVRRVVREGYLSANSVES
jgi:hypothetical protein